MTALIRAELLSLRTVRSTYALAAGLLLLVVSITVADLSDAGKPIMDSAAELREPMVSAAGIVAAVFIALMAAIRVGGEYRYDTIAQRVLASPVRDRLLASRIVTYALAGAVVSAVVFGVAAAITVPMVGAEDLSLGLSAGDVATLAGEVMLSGALLSVVGVAIGILTRSQTAAILTLLGVFIGERLIGGMLGDVANYLPSSLIDSLLENQGAALDPGVAAIALAGAVAAVTVAAAAVLRRRDVT
jgi:ABC-2 type transport system permease protein